ncbi:MAG: serine/threonine protein kinase [Deltaproteobacteria bacterium]|nr:serine/threonine protein kinase [Deltaproteobacteria bacterium]
MFSPPSSPSSPSSPSGGRTYELLSPAGVGGMATVWMARMHGQGDFSRTVAIKRLLPMVAEDDETVRMFAEEARVTSELNHPNIVQVYDFVRDEAGRGLIVMEWVDGLDLGRLIRAHARTGRMIPWPLVTAIGIELLRGLGAAHRRVDAHGNRAAVIHRDITPANVLLSASGAIKLTDFGMSRAMDRATITAPGTLKGKMPYMAPEYLGVGEASERTDLWSVGAVLFEAFTLEPLRNETAPTKIFGMASRQAPSVHETRDDVPERLSEIIAEVLSVNPAARPESARELVVALSAVLREYDGPADEVPLAELVRAARD